MKNRTELSYQWFANNQLNVLDDKIDQTLKIWASPQKEVVINRKAYDSTLGQCMSQRRASQIIDIMKVVEYAIVIDQHEKIRPLHFMTITTCQHKTKEQDKYFSEYLGIWLKQIPNDGYLWTAERQTKSTNDIHFHVLIYCEKIDIKSKLRLLNKKFKGTGTNALNVKPVLNRGSLGAAKYISSYQVKSLKIDKEVNRVYCRVSQVSYKLRDLYKKYNPLYKEKIEYNQAIEDTQVLYTHQYCTLRKY